MIICAGATTYGELGIEQQDDFVLTTGKPHVDQNDTTPALLLS